MPSTSRQKPLPEAAARVIRSHVARVAFSQPLQRCDREDLEQELLTHLVARMDRYEPRRGSLATFADRVTKNRLLSLRRHQQAAKRNARRCRSLHTEIHDRNGDVVERIALAQYENLPAATGQSYRSAHEHAELRMDLASVVACLPASLQVICQQLSQKSVCATARDLNLPRSTLYARVRAVRRQFEQASLEKYL